MTTTILTIDLQQSVRRLAGAATNRHEVSEAVFGALRDASIDPEAVSLDDMKALVADAVVAARNVRSGRSI